MMKASAAQKTLIVGSLCPPTPSTAIRLWPDGEQDAAEQHRLALAEVAVGEIAAEHRRDVDQAGVGAVDEVRLAVGEQPVLGQVEDQQRAHAVVGETLPHLGEEEHVEALRVARRTRAPAGWRSSRRPSGKRPSTTTAIAAIQSPSFHSANGFQRIDVSSQSYAAARKARLSALRRHPNGENALVKPIVANGLRR